MMGGMTKSFVVALLGVALLCVCGCKMDKDYSMRTGSYQASNLKATYYLDLQIYKEGDVKPRFYLGPVKLIKGDYRAVLRMDNPTFSEDLLVELLDSDRTLMSEHEVNFWRHPDDDDPYVPVLIRKGAVRRKLTVEHLVVPYSKQIAWLKLKKQYIRFNHEEIIQELPGQYRQDREKSFNPLQEKE